MNWLIPRSRRDLLRRIGVVLVLFGLWGGPWIWGDFHLDALISLIGIGIAFVATMSQLMPFKLNLKAILFSLTLGVMVALLVPIHAKGWVHNWHYKSINSRMQATEMGFGLREHLGAIDMDQQEDLEEIALVIHSSVAPPAYWVGLHSHSYENGSWELHQPQIQVPCLQGFCQITEITHETSGNLQDFEVEIKQNLHGILFRPEGFSTLSLGISPKRDPSSSDWSANVHSYQIKYHKPEDLSILFQALAYHPPPNRLDLDYPSELAPWLDSLLPINTQLGRDTIVDTAMFALMIAKAVNARLSSHFHYRLNPPPSPHNQDPLIGFLRDHHSGYCAYFASAAILSLRRAGIPARLAKGFAFPEQIDDKTWVLRNRNAHAWLEYWNGQSWQLMDPTPVGFEPFRPWESGWRKWSYRLEVMGESLKKWIFSPWCAGLLLCASFIALGMVFYRPRKKNWKDRLANIEKTLAQHGILRQEWEPVSHLIDQIHRHTNKAQLESLRLELEIYQKERFQRSSS